jgi:hypothetical protein
VFRVVNERFSPNAADARLVRVEVWEGPDACASYEE